MHASDKLTLIKVLHTLIWVFYNVVIFYLLWAVISNRIDEWVWVCLALIAAEGAVLLLFKNICPVTLLAKKYADASSPNFDIFLPAWLARYNKLIYTSLVAVSLIILVYQVIKKQHQL